MTVPVDIQREGFVGDGSTKTFNFNASFLWWNDSELEVYLEDVAAETFIPWRKSEHYKLTGGKGALGGTITTVAADALTSNDKIHVLRILPLRHKIDFEDGKTLNFESIERSDDRLIAIMQQIDEGISRAIRVPINEDADFTWPTKDERRGLWLGFVNDTEAQPYAAAEPSTVTLGDNLEAIQDQITPASGKVLQWTGSNTIELIDSSSLMAGIYSAYDAYAFPPAPDAVSEYEFFTGLEGLDIVRVEIFLHAVTSDGNTGWLVRLGDTTSGYLTSGYVSASVSVNGAGVTVGVNVTGILIQQHLAGDPVGARVTLVKANAERWVAVVRGMTDYPSGTCIYGMGKVDLTTPLDRVKIVATGGDKFDAGSVRCTYQEGS